MRKFCCGLVLVTRFTALGMAGRLRDGYSPWLFSEVYSEAKVCTIRKDIQSAERDIAEILSKVVYGKKAHPRLITVKQLVLAVPLHR